MKQFFAAIFALGLVIAAHYWPAAWTPRVPKVQKPTCQELEDAAEDAVIRQRAERYVEGTDADLVRFLVKPYGC
jgi:hypothetical protein